MIDGRAWLRRVVAATFTVTSAVSLVACGNSKQAVSLPSCPAAATIASITETTATAPKVTRTAASVSCLYQQDGGGVAVDINQSNVTVGQFRAAQAAGASAYHESPTPVGGYGRAAYILSGRAATLFSILTRNDVVTITGSLTATETEAVARYVLAHLPGGTGE